MKKVCEVYFDPDEDWDELDSFMEELLESYPNVCIVLHEEEEH